MNKEKRDANFYWKRYTKGKDYMDKKNLIEETNRNWNFFIGKQWEGLEKGNMQEPPFYNFIKRHVEHKVASISQTSMTVRYSDLNGGGNQDLFDRLNGMYESCREKANFNLLDRQTLREAAITGDGFQYFGTSDIKDVQRLNTTSILLGDESETDVQRQPYIIIEERLPIETVKKIGIENGKTPEELSVITPDRDLDRIVGNDEEIEHDSLDPNAKVTCIIYLEKVNGVVYTCRTTKNCIFKDFAPIEAKNKMGKTRGLTLYPLVKISWEDYPNSARGVSEVKAMIPNQIELNQTLARISITNKQMAFPRLAVDANSVINRDELNRVGGIIELNGDGLHSVSQMIQYLNPAQFSSEPREFADNLLKVTQELNGSGETTMGNINPNRVAASAYTEIRDQANLILGEKEERAIQFTEDRARLLIEMWSVYMTDGLTYTKEEIDETTGELVAVEVSISQDELNSIKADVRVDVARADAWSKEAEQKFVDTLLETQKITFEEAVELYSDTGVAPKQKLRQLLAKRRQAQMAAQMMETNKIMDDAIAAWEEQDGNTQPQMQ